MNITYTLKQIETLSDLAIAKFGTAQWQRCSYNAGVLSVPDDIAPQVQGIDITNLRPVLAPKVKTECQRRIYLIASPNTQMNIASSSAVGALSAADTTTFKSALAWVAAMRSAAQSLIANMDTDYASDLKWPVLPDGVQDLANRYYC